MVAPVPVLAEVGLVGKNLEATLHRGTAELGIERHEGDTGTENFAELVSGCKVDSVKAAQRPPCDEVGR